MARGTDERGAAADDEVVRHQLPLHRAGDRAATTGSGWRRQTARRGPRGAALGLTHPAGAARPGHVPAAVPGGAGQPRGLLPAGPAGRRARRLRRLLAALARRGRRLGAARRAGAGRRPHGAELAAVRLGVRPPGRAGRPTAAVRRVLLRRPRRRAARARGHARSRRSGLDLVRGRRDLARTDLDTLAGKTVVAGVVSGRDVWRTDLDEALGILRHVRGPGRRGRRQHVVLAAARAVRPRPGDRPRPALRARLAFADQKVAEVVALADSSPRRPARPGAAPTGRVVAATSSARQAPARARSAPDAARTRCGPRPRPST